METDKISLRQLQMLVVFYTVGTSILIIPSGLAADAKQDAWLAALLGIAAGLLVVRLYVMLGSRMRGMNFVDYSRYALGGIAGSAIGAVFVFFAFIGSATLLFYIGNFMTTQIMIQTPIETIHILVAAIVVWGIRLGLETLARSAEIFFPWFILLAVVLTFMLLPQLRIENFQPVFETEMKPLAKASLSVVGTASLTMVSLFMIHPSSTGHLPKAGKAIISAAGFGGFIMVVITALCIGVLGVHMTERSEYPSYILATKISIGDFLERVEAIVAVLWILSIYYKLTLYFYACVTGFARLLRIADYRPLALPFGLLLVIFGQTVYPNTAFMHEWDSKTFIPYILTIGLIIPCVLLCVSYFRGRGS